MNELDGYRIEDKPYGLLTAGEGTDVDFCDHVCRPGREELE